MGYTKDAALGQAVETRAGLFHKSTCSDHPDRVEVGIAPLPEVKVLIVLAAGNCGWTYRNLMLFALFLSS
jgi:hypothetical protein